MYEEAREKVAAFVGGAPSNTIFFRGTTEAVNTTASSLSKSLLKRGDEILVSIAEHHSNFLPWRALGKQGIRTRVVKLNSDYEVDYDALSGSITKNTRVIALTHSSNVLGTRNNIKAVSRIAHDHGALLFVDGAQSVPHMKTDIKSLGADFLAFSGHKMLAPSGTGAMVMSDAAAEIMKNAEPFQYGGGMIKSVSLKREEFAGLPSRFEAGTMNIEGTIAMGNAVDYLNRIGMENVEEHEAKLSRRMLSLIKDNDNVELYGPVSSKNKLPLVSFNIRGVHSHDTAALLDQRGVAVRASHHCAQPLMDYLGIKSSARASAYIYNDYEDLDVLMESIDYAIRKIGRKNG